MTTFKTYLIAALCLTAASSRLVRADDNEIDVRSFEYVDVIETTDGSVWKGIVVEQQPNVQYKVATSDGSLHVIKAADVVKMSKQRNRDYQPPHPVAGGATGMRPDGVGTSYESGSSLPAPLAKSGLRLEPSMLIVFPAGDIKGMDTSFTPNLQVGYEQLFGNFGIGGGGLARFTYWRLPGMTSDAAWTLEAQAYVRAALHISRASIYAGVALGTDTNYVYVDAASASKTTLGFGINLQSGVELAPSPTLALKLGFDYHPGTDTIADGASASISYFALLFGAALRM